MTKALCGCVSIFAGGAIYLVWRDQNLLLFEWIDLVGLAPLVEVLRDFGRVMENPPDWAIFSLPNALWFTGGSLILANIWTGDKLEGRLWILCFAISAFGLEFGQLVGAVDGIYDNSDILLMCASCLLLRLIK